MSDREVTKPLRRTYKAVVKAPTDLRTKISEEVEEAVRRTMGCATHLDEGLINDTVAAALSALKKE